MRILFDTNVVLDLLLDREPHALPAADLCSRAERGEISGFLGATTVTTVHYLATKVTGKKRARREIERLLTLFEVAPVNRHVLEAALRGKFPDFEDAVLYEAARQVDAQAVVTRNVRDFKGSVIPIYLPQEMVKMLDTLDASKA